MCLILIKPEKVRFTDEFIKIAERAFRGNPDGAAIGIRRKRTDGVQVRRGYMEVDSLLTQLEELKIDKEDSLVLHVRIATQGSVCPENTHGFIISNEKSNWEKLNGFFYDSIHVFHNGGFCGRASKANFDFEKDYSDTKLITKNLLSEKIQDKTFAELLYDLREKSTNQSSFNSTVEYKFPTLGHNKVALLSGKKGLLTFGTFHEDENGFMHSHTGYIKRNTMVV